MDLLDPESSPDYAMQCIKWCIENNEPIAVREHLKLHGTDLTAQPHHAQGLCDLLQDACNNGKTDVALVLFHYLEPEVKCQLKDAKSWLSKTFYNVVVAGNCLLVKAMVNEGAVVNATFFGKPVTHVAACYGHTAIVQEMVKAGANIQAIDQRGNGIIHEVLQSQLDNKAEVVQELIRLGADPLMQSSSGKLPIHIAALNSPDVLELFIHHGHAVDVPDSINHETPLHVACGIACQDTIVKLIHFGCKFNIENNKGETPLAKLLRFTNDFHDFHTKTRLKMAKQLFQIGFRISSGSQLSKGKVRGRDKTYENYVAIRESICSPTSLQDLARRTFRESSTVSSVFHKYVRSIDIPQNLRPYILYRDFQFEK